MERPIKTDRTRLEEWLSEVLRNETKGATLELANGEEAEVFLEDDCLVAHTWDDDLEESPTCWARIRLVSEDPAED